MRLVPNAGLAIDAASGLLLVFLGLYLLRLRPRQPRSTALAAFSASLGALFFLVNLLGENDPLGPWLRLVGWLFAVPTTAALVWFAGQLALPPLSVSRREAVRQVAVRAVVAAAAGATLLSVLLAILPLNEDYPVGLSYVAGLLLLIGVAIGRAAGRRLAPELWSAALAAALGAAMVGGHAMWFLAVGGDARTDAPFARGVAAAVLYPVLISGFCYALTLLALRWGELATAPEGTGARRSAVSATVALAMYPGLAVGMGGTPWQYEVFLLVAFLAIPVVWFRNAVVARRPDARIPYLVGLLTLGLVVAGAAAGRFLGGPEAAVNAGPMGIARVVTVLALAYGVLRRQLFDIDIKVKRAVTQGLIAIAFVAAFVLAFGASAALDASTVAPVAGLAALGLLGLGLGPIQRGAQRLADAAFPGVEDSPAYLNMRRLEVYRTALDQALDVEGRFVSSKAEVQLAELRARLVITDRDHAVLEHTLRQARPGAARLPIQPGDFVLGKYRIVRLLGEGSFGRTHLAETAEGESVVLKMLRPDRARDPSLLREARAMGALRHPRVVALLDLEKDAQGSAVLVLEYVAGGSLAKRLLEGPLGAGSFRIVALDILEALGAVHAAGLLHRDVKPSNLLLETSGRAKLADFGVAEVPGAEATVGSDTLGPGTVRFMSPEHARGRRLSPRSDLFSAGATLYEAYTGRPFLAPTPNETVFELRLRAASASAVLAEWDGPKALGAWFRKALHVDPARRFASAGAMRAALVKALDPVTRPQT